MTRRSLIARAGAALAAVAVASVSTVVSAEARGPRPAPEWYLPLSPREGQIAELVGRGMTNAEIARTLGMAEWTVRHRVLYLMNKLHLPGRTELRSWVVRQRAGTPPRIHS